MPGALWVRHDPMFASGTPSMNLFWARRGMPLAI
jgi:hypothetical protein